MATVRAPGLFLADPLDVPTEAVDDVAGQVGAADPSKVKECLWRRPTRFEHQREIAREYGYNDFAAAEPDPIRWIDARAWTAGDGPKAIFDAAFTALSRAATRRDDLHVTVAATLTAHALNAGFGPVISDGIPALTRGRISHVDATYLRPETYAAANSVLIDAQDGIGLARA